MSELSGTAQWMAAWADMGLKSSVWLGLAVVLLWAMRHETAQARHRVCLIALGGLCFLPLLRGLPFAWKIPLTPVWTAWVLPASPNHAARPKVPAHPARLVANGQSLTVRAAPEAPAVIQVNAAEHSSTRFLMAGAVSDSGVTRHARMLRVLRPGVLASQPGVLASRAFPPRPSFPSIAPCLAGVWLAGFGLVMLHNLNGWRALRCLQRHSATVEEGRLYGALRDAAREIGGIKRPLCLRIGAQAGGFAAPMTWGWRRPVVWLPSAAKEWTPERARVVLLHETAHIRRGDWLFSTGAACLCAILWFHPLVWLLRRRLHTESERACDDCVLQSGVSAKRYAGHLLDIARTLKSARAAPSGGVTMARSSQIEARLKAILTPHGVSRSPWAQARRRLAACAMPVALLPLCAAQLTPVGARSSDRAGTTLPGQKPHAPTFQATRPILPLPVSNSAPKEAFAAHAPNTGVSSPALARIIPAGKPPLQPSIRRTVSISEPHLFAALSPTLTFPVPFSLPPVALRKNAGLAVTNASKGRRVNNVLDTGGMAGEPASQRDEWRAPDRVPAPNEPTARPDRKQPARAAQESPPTDKPEEVKLKQENGGAAQTQPADIEPDAARLLNQSAEAYSALTSLSLTIHSEQMPPFIGLTHADWNIQWKYPNRAILACRNATGTARTFADGSSLYVFTRRDTRRYARLPLKSNGTDAWRQIGQSAFDDGVTGLGYFTALMRGENLLHLFGTQLRSLKLGTQETLGDAAVQNVLAEMEYRFTQPFARAPAPATTHRSLLTFAIGINDHLVRRVTIKALTPPGAHGERLIESTQTFADIKINPDLPDALFAFTPPAGLEAEDSVDNLGERNHAHYLKPGVTAPDFTARDIQGRTVSLSQYRGKTVLLIFWTRDCGSTPWETDDMTALYRKYHAKGLEIIGICDDYISRPATLPAFLAKHGMTWPQIRDGGRARGPIFRLYGVKGTTQMMLLTPDGKLLNPDVNILPLLELQLEQLFHPSHP